MNQRQLQMIDYLRDENRVLREQLGVVRKKKFVAITTLAV
jgi:hypothetical protein